jgi:hypothetical protein
MENGEMENGTDVCLGLGNCPVAQGTTPANQGVTSQKRAELVLGVPTGTMVSKGDPASCDQALMPTNSDFHGLSSGSIR